MKINMKTDIFLLKIGKSCLSDAKTKYLIEEWYLENYGIDPDVIGHATMWQVVWENCQGFIGRFWSVKQVLELIQRDSFHQPSGSKWRSKCLNRWVEQKTINKTTE